MLQKDGKVGTCGHPHMSFLFAVRVLTSLLLLLCVQVWYTRVFNEEKNKFNATKVSGSAICHKSENRDRNGDNNNVREDCGRRSAYSKPRTFIHSGTVLMWNEAKQLGYIMPEHGGSDLYCYSSDIRDGNMLATESKAGHISPA